MLIEITILSAGATYFLKKKKSKKRVQSTSKQLTNTTPHKVKNSLYKNMLNTLSGSKQRQQQLRLNPAAKAKMNKESRENNRKLVTHGGVIGIATLGAINPAFRVAGMLSALYLTIPLYRFIWNDFKAKRVSPSLVDGVLVVGMVFTGHVLLVGLTGVLAALRWKLIKQTEENSYSRVVDIFNNHPSRVWVEKEGVEIQIDYEKIQADDVIIVNTGETIPVDGIIIHGFATIDQQLLTGESIPAEKTADDKVFASTLLISGRIKIKVETTGENTVAAQIGGILENTKNYKDMIVERGYKFAADMAPVSLGVSALTGLLLGPTAAVAALWAPVGANMIYLGPISVLIYLQIFSQHNILIKDGRVLESLQKVDTVVFDKTGTLTDEIPEVGKIHTFGSFDEDTVLYHAAAAEYRQPHPIAKAILAKAEERNQDFPVPDEANYEVGYGIKVSVKNKRVYVGSARFINNEGVTLPDSAQEIRTRAEENGYSLIYVCIDEQLAGIFEMHPSIRPETAEIISYLKQRGTELYIISGDHEKPTRRMAKQLGINHYFAETLPEDKANIIEQLKESGKFVCFIGDGINDTIALKSSHVSISLRGASTAATDTAQVILMDGNLSNLKKLFQTAEEFDKNMRNNLLTSTVPGAFCIGGIYFMQFGIIMAMIIKYMSLAGGFINTMQPLVTISKEKPQQLSYEEK